MFPSRGGGGYSDFGDSTITFYIYIMKVLEHQSCGRVGREQSHIRKVWIHDFYSYDETADFPSQGWELGPLGIWVEISPQSCRAGCVADAKP